MTNAERPTVSRWTCPSCRVDAVKIRGRWVIEHDARCADSRGAEDVGPVTSVNDPDNAYFVADD